MIILEFKIGFVYTNMQTTELSRITNQLWNLFQGGISGTDFQNTVKLGNKERFDKE
jgi:hypothetical protein